MTNTVYFDPAVGGDGTTVTDDSNATTGLGNSGHRTRFVPALSQTVAVAANTVTKATEAAASAVAAAASAASAVASPGANATSTSSVAIGLGAKTFTTQASKSFVAGMNIMVADNAAPTTNYMFGMVTSYSGTTLIIDVKQIAGSGTLASWTISLSGPLNIGVFNEVKGANIASAGTIDLDIASGNLVHVTGTTTITAITLSSGRERTVVFDGVLILTHHATTLILPGGENITTAAGDSMIVRGDGSGNVRVISYTKASGLPVIDRLGGGASTAVDLVLTSSSAGAHTITPTTYNQSITLPNATTITESAIRYIISNEGDFPVKVIDGSGVLLGFLDPRTASVFGLTDNSTSAGVWIIPNLSFMAVTAEKYANGVTTAADNIVVKTMLDANRTLITFGGLASSSVTVYGVVYDASTKLWGAVTAIRTSCGEHDAILQSTDKVLITSCNSTTGFEAVILSISGTTITVNTAATATLSAAVATFGEMTLVGTSVILSYGVTGSNEARCMTVSGTTVTIGAAVTLSGTSSASFIRVFSVSSTVALIFSTTNSSTYYASTYTLSGATLTLGNTVNLSVTINPTQDGLNKVVAFGSRWLGILKTSASVTTGWLLSVSGSTVSASSVAVTTSADSVGTAYSIIGSKVTVFTAATANNGACFTLTDTAGTISAGSVLSFTSLLATNTVIPIHVKTVGNIISFYLYGDNKQELINIDATGVTPIRYTTNPGQMFYVSNTLHMTPTLATINGVRGVNGLYSSIGFVQVANGPEDPCSWYATPNRIVKLPQMTIPLSGAVIVGENANELWRLKWLAGSLSIVRIECKA